MIDEPDLAPKRDDTDDHDLLTYGEVGVRLYEEVEAQRKVVESAVASGASPDVVDKAKKRLADLAEARDRNSRQPLNDTNFEQFFGYAGTAKRNT